MPHIQTNKKVRQANQIGIILPAVCMDFSRKSVPKEKSEEHSINIHLELINKIDRLLKEHEGETLSEEPDHQQQISDFPEESSIEIRAPLNKIVELSELTLEKKPDDIFSRKETILVEFKPDFPITNNPDFRYVTALDSTENILRIKDEDNERIEIIDLSSLMVGKTTVQRKSTLILDKDQVKEEQTSNNSKNKSDSDKIQNKKVEIVDTRKFGNKKQTNKIATAMKQSKEIEEKSRVYYLKTSKQKERKSAAKQSYIQEDLKRKELEQK